MKQAVVVSPEMTTLVGTGPAPGVSLPEGAAMFLFGRFSEGASPVLSYRETCDLEGVESVPLVFAIDPCGAREFGDGQLFLPPLIDHAPRRRDPRGIHFAERPVAGRRHERPVGERGMDLAQQFDAAGQAKTESLARTLAHQICQWGKM